MNAPPSELRDVRYEVVGLKAEHLPKAAALFLAGYREKREREPTLPSRHEDARVVLAKLMDLAQRSLGVVAIRNGRLVGFLLGQTLPSFRGKRTAYSPEWANAAQADGRRDIYLAMYAGLSSRWVADGCLTHLISFLAHDGQVADGLSWMEFGLTAVDAIRDLRAVAGTAADVPIRRAGGDDAEAVLTLCRALQEHLAAAPIFRPLTDRMERNMVEKRLADSNCALWLAWCDDEPAAYMHIQPANPTAAYIIEDPKTASIKAAFTKECYRGRGLGLALLNRALEWALSAGYERCAVDFEPQNIPAARFWMKHFRPVCYTMIRRVDGRIGLAAV